MAVIGKIRERSGLLLVIIGGALAAFILTDLFSGGRTGRQDQVLGVVGGEEISLLEYERRVTDEVDSYRNDFGQQVDAQMMEQVRTSVWNEMVKERVMLERARRAGIALTKAEYDDIRFGENILPDLRGQPNFQGPDGRPDRDALRNYFNNVQINAPMYHGIQKRRITENRLYAKYNTLVKKSIFVNRVQAEDDHHGKNTRSTFNFVAKRYDSEPDSLYPVSEHDLRSYYDRHKNDAKHRQKPSRRFQFVLFPVTATPGDREHARKELDGLREDFASATNDSLFVTLQAESRFYNLAPYTEGTADQLNDSLLLNAREGEVIGPFLEGDQWKLVKVVELADLAEARVRHILLDIREKDEASQKKRADSLLTVVKRDRSKFEAMVAKFSDDPGSTGTGGVYEWFDRNTMVPEFTAASFDEKVGAITIAKTMYGFHIVEVLGQRTRQERRVATIERTVKPTPATFKDVYKKANDFSLRHKSAEEFKQGAEELGLEVVPVEDFRPDMRYVPGLQEPNSVITWANRAKTGAVSEPLDAGENYVVAILTGIRKQGVPDLEDVREPFTKEVVKEKKAEAFAKLMVGTDDLYAVGTELKLGVQNATGMLFNSFTIPGGYVEHEVIGKIFAMEPGQTSIPLKGDNAVYVVQVTDKTTAEPPEDTSTERASLHQRLQGRAENALFNALREAAGVKDNRSQYY